VSIDNSKRFKKLFLKAEYLSAELDETIELFDEYSSEFSKKLGDIKAKEKSNPITDCVAEMEASMAAEAEALHNEEDSDPGPEMPSDFKKIYKKIMTIVHPDKLEFMDDEVKKSRYMSLASAANDAAGDLNWYDMAKIAIELGVDMGDISDQQIISMEEACDKVLRKVSGMKNSYPWAWASSNDVQREIVFNYYVENVL
jgi:hypothetical protein